MDKEENTIRYIVVEKKRYNDRGNEWDQYNVLHSKDNAVKVYETFQEAELAARSKMKKYPGSVFMVRDVCFEIKGTIHKIKKEKEN